MATKFTIEHDTLGGTYEFPARYTFGEGRLIEKVTGAPLNEARGATAVQAQVWIAMRRVHPDLAFSDLDDIEMLGDEDIQSDEQPDEDEVAGDQLDPTAVPAIGDSPLDD